MSIQAVVMRWRERENAKGPIGKDVARWLQLACIVLLLSSQPGVAVEVGQTRDEVIFKHGLPFSANGDTANYRWDLWSLDIDYVEGVAVKLAYRKETPLSDGEILGILAANGGKDAWTKFNDRLWVRNDGASGNIDAADPKAFWIQAKPRSAPTVSVAATATPGAAAAPIERATTPIFRKAENAKPQASAIVAMIIMLLIFGALFGVLFWIRSLRKAKIYPAVSGLTLNRNDFTIPPPLTLADNDIAEVIPPSSNSITWDQFELAVAEIYRRQGYEAEISSGLGADGGIDVKLTRDGATTLVQCKQWKSSKVGVKEIREFYGVLISEGAERGIFVSTAEYSRDAKEFAKGKAIDLLTRQDIQQLVSAIEYSGEDFWDISQWLDALIANSRIVDPVCPYCRESMIIKQPKSGGPSFWGCRTYPRCRGVRNARLEIIQAKSFQPTR